MADALRPAVEPRAMVGAIRGQIPSGVALVMTLVDGRPHAATASSGVVASFDPPRFAVFFAAGSRMQAAMARGAGFTVSLLRESDQAIARRFADPVRTPGWAGFADLELVRREPAVPYLAHAAAWLDCRLEQTVAIGDHVCFVGAIVAGGRDPAAMPLAYWRGRFHGLGPVVAPVGGTRVGEADLAAVW